MAPILDMPPRTLSELYASGQGAAARLAVKGVQTPLEDEIRTVDVQTEEVGTSESAAQYDVRDLVTKRVEGVVKGQNGRLAGLLERALQAVNQGRLGSSGLVDRVVSLMNHPRVQKYRAVQEILSFVKSAVRGGGTGASEGGGDEEKQLADLLEEALEGESTGRGVRSFLSFVFPPYFIVSMRHEFLFARSSCYRHHNFALRLHLLSAPDPAWPRLVTVRQLHKRFCFCLNVLAFVWMSRRKRCRQPIYMGCVRIWVVRWLHRAHRTAEVLLNICTRSADRRLTSTKSAQARAALDVTV